MVLRPSMCDNRYVLNARSMKMWLNPYLATTVTSSGFARVLPMPTQPLGRLMSGAMKCQPYEIPPIYPSISGGLAILAPHLLRMAASTALIIFASSVRCLLLRKVRCMFLRPSNHVRNTLSYGSRFATTYNISISTPFFVGDSTRVNQDWT